MKKWTKAFALAAVMAIGTSMTFAQSSGNLWQQREQELAKQKYALLIIDMQNDFVLKNAPHRVDGALTHLPEMIKALKFFRDKKMLVFHVTRNYRKDGSDVEITRLKKFLEGPQIVVPGTKGAEIVKELKPIPGEYTIIKRRFSAFMETELNFMLKRLNVGHVVVCGIDLAHCVRETVFDGVRYGYDVSLLVNASASSTEEVAKDNIRDMRNIGVKCMTVKEFEKHISSLKK